VSELPAGVGGLLIDVERTSSGGFVVLTSSPFGGSWCNVYSAQGSYMLDVEPGPGGIGSASLVDLERRSDGTFLLGSTFETAPYTAHVRAFDVAGNVL
jgi:hypothetical protein